jgi:phospholipid-binding lipoprotein MlaA
MRIAHSFLLVLSLWSVGFPAPCLGEISTSSSSFEREEGILFAEAGDSSVAKPQPVINSATAPLNQTQALRLCQLSDSGKEGNEPRFPGEEVVEEGIIADPLEPLNRVFFNFNDRLYFWFLKPVATGYNKALPEPLRVSVRNFFSNLFMPVRAVNCLLQGKIQGFGIEITRFLLNSTMGVLGFGDPANVVFNIRKKDEDFGQTLGFIGIGPGIYINWPILGPSSLRDTVGLIGDGFLDPVNYLVPHTRYNIGVKAYEKLNGTSLVVGEYESLKKAALDPYVSLRNAYYQHRQHKIRE